MNTRRTTSRTTRAASNGRRATTRTSTPPRASSNGNGGNGGYGGSGGARSAIRGIQELGGIEFVDDAALAEYCRRVRDLARELAGELEFGGYQLEAALRGIRAVPGLPGAGRIRARKVARALLVAAESARITGAKAVECHALFLRNYAPEIEAVRGPQKDKPTFEIRPDGDPRL